MWKCHAPFDSKPKFLDRTLPREHKRFALHCKFRYGSWLVRIAVPCTKKVAIEMQSRMVWSVVYALIALKFILLSSVHAHCTIGCREKILFRFNFPWACELTINSSCILFATLSHDCDIKHTYIIYVVCAVAGDHSESVAGAVSSVSKEVSSCSKESSRKHRKTKQKNGTVPKGIIKLY